MPVHGRSPLGRLQALRWSGIYVPILTVLVTAPFRLGPNTPETALNPQSQAELEPVLRPLLLALVAAFLVVRFLVRPESAKALRVILLVVVYTLALMNTMAATVYWLSGGPPRDVAAGWGVGAVAIFAVSLARYAHDVSARPSWFG